MRSPLDEFARARNVSRMIKTVSMSRDVRPTGPNKLHQYLPQVEVIMQIRTVLNNSTYSYIKAAEDLSGIC